MRLLSSPWYDTLNACSTRTAIRQASICMPAPFDWVKRRPVDVTEQQLEEYLDSIFLPSQASDSVMSSVVSMTAARALNRYPSMSEYITHLNQPHIDPPKLKVVCITGLAGTGKSAVVAALRRCLPVQSAITVPGHGVHGHMPMAPIRLTEKWGMREVARQLGAPMHRGLDLCRWLYGNGCSLIALDELQFLAPGSNSSARASKLIYELSMLGPLLVVSCNFSLVRKLQRRNKEERDRILGEPRVLCPDAPDSECWKELLKAWDHLLSQLLGFRLYDHAGEFWCLTAGIKRAAVRLLCLAFRRSVLQGKRIAWADIWAAFESQQFKEMGRDVLALLSAGLGGQHPPLDLQCPFDSAEFAEYWRSVRKAALWGHSVSVGAQSMGFTSTARPESASEPSSEPKSQGTRSTRRVKRDAGSMNSAAERFRAGAPRSPGEV